jgi:uncharacterized protein
MNFANKYVLITGASSGIGFVFAQKFAQRGAHLVITARRKDRLELLRAEIINQYPSSSVHCIVEDLTADGAVDRLKSAIDALGIDIDILINNAGFGYKGLFLGADRKTYLDMIALNMSVLTDLTYAFMPAMVHKQFGGVLNVASMAGVRSIPYFAVYASSKAYVLNFTEALWQEYKGSGVHISALCPGPVETEFFEVSGYNPSGADARSIQTPEAVVDAAIKGLIRNKPIVPTSWLLRVLTAIQVIIPRKIGLWVLEKNMK